MSKHTWVKNRTAEIHTRTRNNCLEHFEAGLEIRFTQGIPSSSSSRRCVPKQHFALEKDARSGNNQAIVQL
jgi:hypothetical protein